MKFAQRFAYYLVGLVLGLFFVGMVFSGKDVIIFPMLEF